MTQREIAQSCFMRTPWKPWEHHHYRLFLLAKYNLASHTSIKKSITNEGSDGGVAAIYPRSANVQRKENSFLQQRNTYMMKRLGNLSYMMKKRERVVGSHYRSSWSKVIPFYTFRDCENLETVIMSDTVRWIEWCAFFWCSSLKFVKLSRNLEYIGNGTFKNC